MEAVVETQQQINEQMQKLLANFKKDGPDRKTTEYIKRRLEVLEQHWVEYQRNHEVLTQKLHQHHEYIRGGYYDNTRKLYLETRDLLQNYQQTFLKLQPVPTTSQVTSPSPSPVLQTTPQAPQSQQPIPQTSQGTNSKLDEMLKKQSSNFKAFVRTVSNIQVENMNEKWEFEDTLKSLQTRWQVIDSLHWEIDSELDGSNWQYESTFSEHEQRYNEIKRSINSKLWSVAHREKSTPQLDIPMFTGNYQQWVSFKDLFCEAVHNNPSLSNAQKMQFLKSKLRGEAERLIQHLQISSENYMASWEILNHRYNNKKLIFTSHVNTLMNIPSMQQSTSVQIKRLHDVTKECLNAIKNLDVNIDTWDPILIHILSQKLDVETHNEYMASLEHPRDLPKMSDFLAYLENKFTAMESSRRKQESGQRSNINNPTVPIKQERTQFRPYHSSNKAVSHQSQQAKYFKLNCPVCQSNEHGIYYCPKFLEMSPFLKRHTITKLNFCNNCLYNHYGKTCSSNKRCRECNGNHNSILHEAFTKLRNVTPEASVSRVTSANVMEKTSLHVAQKQNIQAILLATAIIQAKGSDGVYRKLRALVDQGSQVSIITEHAAQLLGLPRQKCTGVITGVGTKDTTCKGKLNISCTSLTENYSFDIEAFIMRSLTRCLPNFTFEKPNWAYLHKIKLADPDFNISRPIDILLGADIYSKIIQQGIYTLGNTTPVAQQTRLGWILCGTAQTLQCNIALNDLDEIKQFWQMEDIPEEPSNSLEDECIKFYRSTTQRTSDGKYVVRLPLKPNIQDLGASKPKAIAQFLNLEKKINKNSTIASEYKKFINEYIALGHMILANQEPSSDYYMPHHCVIKEDSLTTALRVVYNASENTSNGTSLNDCMQKGPNLQKDLLEMILRWRKYQVAFTADIEKMFRQIWVHQEDQNYQKIVWRYTPHELLREYQLTTVTYGTKAAPFLAMMTLRQLAEDERNTYPEAAQVVESCFYMDDLLHGAHDVESAQHLKQDLIKLLKLGGFNLRKWNSNYQEIAEKSSTQEHFSFKQVESTKTLGIHWDPQQDTFIFQSKLEPRTDSNSTTTKRKMLSDISKLFDPAGWLTPVSTKLKILFQRVWDANINWDNKIPADIETEWLKIRHDLINNINKIQVPRWLYTNAGGTSVELHGFCDASQKAYACVIYCKLLDNGNQKVNLVAGKSKLVPHNKAMSLPRLELCGALLLSKLMQKVKQCLSDLNIKAYGWVDSTAVLGWLQGNPERWSSFVANRVRKITEVIPSEYWRYVKSAENPADCASRGLTVTQLESHEMWWQGPTWLPDYKPDQQETISYSTSEDAKQVNVTLNDSSTQETSPRRDIITELLNRYNNFDKAVRVLARVRRIITKKEDKRQEPYLTLTEMKEAKLRIIKHIQGEEFKDEITSILKNNKISTKSKLLCLHPILDSQGVLRVGGRLKHAQISQEMKNPIILPTNSRITELIINDAHKLTYHGGARITTAFIRQKYWVISGIRTTKKYIRQCVTCKRHNPQKQDQLMGDLPNARVNPSRPFYHTGVDFTGHVYVKANKGRGIKTTKGYVAVFVCMATKAVHLELVSDLSTSSFIAALRRMSARRGTPRHLYSDNGRNFVGADRTLQEEYQEIQQVFNEEFIKEMTDMEITWHFNAPSWPTAGGLFEAAVKSFKYHFKRVIGTQTLTFEEFSTLLSQIEACLNARPLCPITEDPDDLNFLTPSHFLSSGPMLTLIETEKDMRTRWHLTQKILQDIWKRWRSEYSTLLSSRSKWRQAKENVKMNDVVLIHDDNLPPGKWVMGRVIQLHPGQDGLVRVVTLKTKSGHIKRPVTRISILTEYKETSENDQAETKEQEKKTRKNKFSFTAMFAAILFFMTLISSSEGMMNITNFRENQGLYFDKVSNMQLIRNEWKLVVFYEMQPYWQGIKALNQYVYTLDKTCTAVKEETQCTAILLQLRHGIVELEYYNQLLMSHNAPRQPGRQPTRRRRRGVINAIGYLAGDLFGVLDERFAEQYKQDINLLRQNQKHIIQLWKNQTSIVEAENNLLKRTELIMNQQHKALNQHILALENAIESTKNVMETNLILSDFAIASIVASNMLNNIKSLQNTLLDTVTDIYQGRLNLHLLTPEQLIEELSTISSQLQNDVSLPVENIHSKLQNIYGLLRVRTRMLEEFLIFEIRLPLVSRDSYEIFKLIPVPKQQDGNMINLIPVSSYVSVNIKRETYIPMTENDVKTCFTQVDTYYCHSQKPEYKMTNDNSLCLLENSECKTATTLCYTQWLESYTINMYIYFCCGQCQVRAMCESQMTAHQLTGAGIINIEHGCVVKTDKVTLYPHRIHTSEVKYFPDLYSPKISPINHVINISVPQFNVSRGNQAELNREVEQVGSEIKTLKETEITIEEEAASVSYHDIHHYVMIYIVFGIVVIVGTTMMFRRFHCKWRVPTAAAPASAAPALPPQPTAQPTSSAHIEMQDRATSPTLHMLNRFS